MVKIKEYFIKQQIKPFLNIKIIVIFSSKFKIKNIKQLEPYQTLYCENNEYKIKSDNSKNIEELKIKNLKNNFPIFYSNYKVKHVENDLNISLKSLKEKIYKYKFSIKKINQTAFFISINKTNKIYKIDFKKFNCLKLNESKNSIINKFKNYLILKVDLNIIANILNRKSHIDNCTIGHRLNWERYPKTYFNSELYDVINFLHK